MFPQLLRADILNMHASLMKTQIRFLALSFISRRALLLSHAVPFCLSRSCEYLVSLSLCVCLSPELGLQIKMFRGVSFNVTSSENITALIGIFDCLGQMRLNIDSSGN